MEAGTRDTVERTMETMRNPLGLLLTPGLTDPSATTSSTIVAQSPRYTDAHTHIAPVHRVVGASPTWNPRESCAGGELIGTKTAETRTVEYVDGPDRTVLVKSGGKDRVAFLLTEETVKLLCAIVAQKRKLESNAKTYEEATRAAKFGAGFLRYSETMLAEATSKEEYDQIKADIDRQMPGIQKELKRKETLDKKRQDWKDELDYSRSKAEDNFEQLLLNSQLMQESQDDESDFYGDSDAMSEDGEMQEKEFTAGGDDLTTSKPLEEFRAARQRLLEAQLDFDSMKSVQEQKTFEYRQLEQDGMVQFPESELDLYHVQMGRDITRALIDAEQFYSEAYAKAQALGLLESGCDQESGLGNGSTDDCSAFMDPGVVAAGFGPSIQAWADKVFQFQEEENVTPETDDWDCESINMSDSVSVVATDRDRKRIDLWRSVCEAGESSSDAMTSAVLFGGHIV